MYGQTISMNIMANNYQELISDPTITNKPIFIVMKILNRLKTVTSNGTSIFQSVPIFVYECYLLYISILDIKKCAT